MNHHDASAAVVAAVAAYSLFIFLLAIASIVLALVINWRIATKAGYSGPLSLLMLIPLVNFVVLLLFAFTEWPIEQQLKAARGGGPGPGPVAWQPPMVPGS